MLELKFTLWCWPSKFGKALGSIRWRRRDALCDVFRIKVLYQHLIVLVVFIQMAHLLHRNFHEGSGNEAKLKLFPISAHSLY